VVQAVAAVRVVQAVAAAQKDPLAAETANLKALVGVAAARK